MRGVKQADGTIKDYVYCVNCSWYGLVEQYTDDCPNCDKGGCLMWADDKPDLPDEPEG